MAVGLPRQSALQSLDLTAAMRRKRLNHEEHEEHEEHEGSKSLRSFFVSFVTLCVLRVDAFDLDLPETEQCCSR